MTDIADIPIATMEGDTTSLGDYAGKVLLVVNVASKCGLTPQYEGLEALYEKYQDRGLVVLGFPANDFMEQEPGTDADIAEFCAAVYQVQFPVFSKISVVGDDQHPLYAALTGAIGHASGDPEAHRDRLKSFDIATNDDPDILWNFEKFLVSRDGRVVGRFAPNLVPEAPELVEAIEAQLDA